MSISHNDSEFEYQLWNYLLWDVAHNTKDNLSLQWATPLGKKNFFLFQVLVTFFELQKTLEHHSHVHENKLNKNCTNLFLKYKKISMLSW